MKSQALEISQALEFFNGKLTATNQKEEQTANNFFATELVQVGKLKFLQGNLTKLVIVKKVRTEKSQNRKKSISANHY